MEGAATGTAIRGSFSASVSLASTPGASTARGVSSAVAYESLLAVGGVLTRIEALVTVGKISAVALKNREEGNTAS